MGEFYRTNPTTTLNNEPLSCSECGFPIKRTTSLTGVVSSLCSNCGNIEYYTVSEVAQPETSTRPKPLATQGNASSLSTEEIQARIHTEWEFWLEVTRHFGDPIYHSAYISRMMLFRELPIALERYLAHSKVMMLLENERWQCEIADQMIHRIQSLTQISMQRESTVTRLPAKYYLQSKLSEFILESPTARLGWIFLGLYLGLHFLR